MKELSPAVRATEYIRDNQKNLCQEVNINDLKRIIQELRVIRLDPEATTQFFYDKLRADHRYEMHKREHPMDNSYPEFKHNTGEIDKNDIPSFRSILYNVVENDPSFEYITCDLARYFNQEDIWYKNKPLNAVPDKDRVEKAIIPIQDFNQFVTVADEKAKRIYTLLIDQYKSESSKTLLIALNTIEFIRLNYQTQPYTCLDLLDEDFPLEESWKDLIVYCCKLLMNDTSVFTQKVQTINLNMDKIPELIQQLLEQVGSMDFPIENSKKDKKQKEEVPLFRDLLNYEDKDKLMAFLHEKLDSGKKGKNLVIYIKALTELAYLSYAGSNAQLYRSLEKEFGKISTNSNFNIYMDSKNNKILPEDIDPIKNALKNL